MNANDEGQQWEARYVNFRESGLVQAALMLHKGDQRYTQAEAADRLNALQQQVTELEGKAALLKEVVDWSPHESWIRKRYAALTSPSTIAQKEMVQ